MRSNIIIYMLIRIMLSFIYFFFKVHKRNKSLISGYIHPMAPEAFISQVNQNQKKIP